MTIHKRASITALALAVTSLWTTPAWSQGDVLLAPGSKPGPTAKPAAEARSQVDAMFPSGTQGEALPVQPAASAAGNRASRTYRRQAQRRRLPAGVASRSLQLPSLAGFPFVLNREVEVHGRSVYLRTGPGFRYSRIVLLGVGQKVAETGRSAAWSQARLGDGRVGWVGTQYLRPAPRVNTVAKAALNPPAADSQKAAALPAAAPKVPAASQTAVKQPAAVQTAAKQPSTAQSAVNTPGSAGASPSTTKEEPLNGLLLDTRKDPFGGAVGAANVGDSFRMLLYLLPILGLSVLAIRGLKKVQQRTGTTPKGFGSLGSALVGGLNLSNSRKTGGSNIRVVESVPVGGMELSLVEVRGRLLLLSTSGGSVSLLTEFKDGADGESEFQKMLGSLAADNEDEELTGTIGRTVGSLDDTLRETREAIVRTAQRTLRHGGRAE